ncbi:MAG: Uncharacterized protein CEN87_757 [Parcubacteria group bacterium Licking1014_1]|nr:MAG: Uncharacterized protein CEN87_757 [Parcubacteria group bacterium Licking1014_1]
MKIEIDQSGKIENTSKDTVIAFSNRVFGSIIFKARNKREVQKIFRKTGKHRIFVYHLFAILIFLLIKNHIKEIDQIIIDNEYPGKSATIKDFLLREIRKKQPGFSKDNVLFNNIGKKSRAHYIAYGVAIGKKLSDKEISIKEVLRLFVK